MLVNVPNAGKFGIIKDLSKHELPLGAWSDGSNVRFLDGYCHQFLGHGSVFGQPLVTPYHVVAVTSGADRYWLYVGADKIFAATVRDGQAEHTNLTRTKSTLGYKYAPQQMYGALGIEDGKPNGMADGLLAGLLNNARSTHAASPSFAQSALLAGLAPANVPSGSVDALVVAVVTNDDNYRMVPNQITSTLLSGIPIINAGNLIDPPQRWNLDAGSRFQTLENWPANTFCKSLRAFKNYLVGLNVTRDGQNFPFMVMWSNAAVPGAIPSTWDKFDETQDAGDTDLAESNGQIIDGLPLRDFFMIYKEDSIWRMTYTGGPYVFAFQKVLGTSGALNRNCIVELGGTRDGYHFVLTGSDVILHDGQQAVSILDQQARRTLFQDFDVDGIDKAFLVKNPFLNEVLVCYASIGSQIPNKALVYNYAEKTVSYRDIPNLYHANYGTLDASLGDSWAADSDPWESDITLWNGPDFTPNTARVLMASADQQLFLLDSSATFDGVKPVCFLERVGLSFGAPKKVKTVRSISPRITGNVGSKIIIRVGAADDPYAEPVYGPPMEHIIGTTVTNHCFVTGRYIAIRFETSADEDTAYFWRLDSLDIDFIVRGDW